MEWIVAHWQEIGIAVMATVSAASAIARLTPTTHDDEVIQAILNFINKLALNKPAQ